MSAGSQRKKIPVENELRIYRSGENSGLSPWVSGDPF